VAGVQRSRFNVIRIEELKNSGIVIIGHLTSDVGKREAKGQGARAQDPGKKL
jgi:hypothetical protein